MGNGGEGQTMNESLKEQGKGARIVIENEMS